MPAPKGNQYAVGNPGGARPDTYRDEHVEEARRFALLGLTHKEMASLFKVSISTFRNWCREHEDFDNALKDGSTRADATVASRLYHRAVGYEHDAVKIFMPAGAAVPVYADYIERHPPETAAAIFWLKNRQRHRWRDRVENVQVDADGNPLKPPTIVIVPPGVTAEEVATEVDKEIDDGC